MHRPERMNMQQSGAGRLQAGLHHHAVHALLLQTLTSAARLTFLQIHDPGAIDTGTVGSCHRYPGICHLGRDLFRCFTSLHTGMIRIAEGADLHTPVPLALRRY